MVAWVPIFFLCSVLADLHRAGVIDTERQVLIPFVLPMCHLSLLLKFNDLYFFFVFCFFEKEGLLFSFPFSVPTSHNNPVKIDLNNFVVLPNASKPKYCLVTIIA